MSGPYASSPPSSRASWNARWSAHVCVLRRSASVVGCRRRVATQHYHALNKCEVRPIDTRPRMSATRRASKICTSMPNSRAAVSTAPSCKDPVVGIPQHADAGKRRHAASMNSSQPFCTESSAEIQEHAGYVAAWASEIVDPAAGHRIAFKINCDHRDIRRRASRCLNGGRASSQDGVHTVLHQLAARAGKRDISPSAQPMTARSRTFE